MVLRMQMVESINIGDGLRYVLDELTSHLDFGNQIRILRMIKGF